MDCKNAIDMYCKLDRGDKMPVRLLFHLQFCPRCKKTILKLESADRLTDINSSRVEYDRNFVDDTMSKINAFTLDNAQDSYLLETEKALTPWVITGLLILLAFVGMPLLPHWRLLTENFDPLFFDYLRCFL